jgi:hypothetical protein
MTNITASISDLKQAIQKKDLNRASSIFSNKLSKDSLKLEIELRKKGVLRCSSYQFDFKVIEALVKIGLKEKSLSHATRKYFESVESLAYIARDIRRIHNELIKEISQGSFKSYLVSVDSLFWQMDESFLSFGSTLNRFNKEQIAMAFSSYFFHLCTQQNNDIQFNSIVDTKAIQDKFFLDNLAGFYKIYQFKEWEILVDRFEYTLTRKSDRKSKMILQSPNIQVEKSICLGYINYQNHEISGSMDSLLAYEKAGVASLIKLATDLSIEHKDKIFAIETYPAKRIVMRMPRIQKLIDLIKNDKIFLEELLTIEFLEKIFLINLQQVKNTEIYSGLSVFDTIKFQRIFLFLFFCFREYIESQKLWKSKLFWRSILPVFTKDELNDFLCIFFDANKSTKIIELLSWNSKSNQIFDVQTFPLINNGTSFILPLGILSKSNLSRNILQSIGYRFDSESSIDPIGKILEDAFASVSQSFKRNVNYSFKGKQGEIDAIVTIDDYTFIFECKNSLHPSNPFEMRTSYDYIEKAASQLDIITNLWQDKQFVVELSKKVGYNLPNKLCTALLDLRGLMYNELQI